MPNFNIASNSRQIYKTKNPKIEKFEDIIVWQKAKEMTIIVYNIFASNKDVNFSDHLQRVSVSVMNNIAKGFERKRIYEFRQFLYIAKDSCAEARSMLYIAKEIKMISDKDFSKLHTLSEEISQILTNSIKAIY